MLRRSFDEDFKMARVRENVSGEKRVGEILEEHGIVSSVFARWRAKYGPKIRKELKAAAAAPAPAEPPSTTALVVASPPPSSEGVKGTKHLSEEQRKELETRIGNKEKPAHIARSMQIHPQTVHYYKKKLKDAGELMPAKAPGIGALVTVTPTMMNLSDQLATVIHAEYDARLVDSIGPKESLMLALWHMHHGRL